MASVYNVMPSEIFSRYRLMDKFNLYSFALCVPDEGAIERCSQIQAIYNIDLVYFEKFRDPDTGEILEFNFSNNNKVGVQCKDILVVDDICDGGKTFIETAKILKQKRAEDLYLYVTHGIFSKGLDELLDYYKHIYCHHVLHDDKFKSTDRLTILREFPHVS